MSIPNIDDNTWRRIEQTVAFFMQNGNRLISLLQSTNGGILKPEFATRGILLQDVFGNGTGLMNTVVRIPTPNSFLMSLIGINPPKSAEFNIKMVGTVFGPPARMDTIFNADIKLTNTDGTLLTCAQIQNAICQASVGGPYPLDLADVQVLLGDPISDPNLIGIQPVPPATVPVSYVGRWNIVIDPTILNTYDSLLMTIETPKFVGLSSVVIQGFSDIVTPSQEIVTDIYNRPEDNPWQAGALVSCIPFIDCGLAIIGSDYRDVTYVPPTSS